jgi:hypothetical protein
MNSERVSIRIVNDAPLIGEFTGFTKGSELLVDVNTATALVLIGIAVGLPAS